jgi:FtsP/CotA-like multicopper oxidase with cupredoxin domain
LSDWGLESVKSHVQNIMPPIPIFSRRVFLGQVFASVLTLPARSETVTPQDDGFRILEARQGSLLLLPEPAKETPVWGYNGEVPGPLLRYKKGEEIKVRLVNKLDQPTSLNWHGVRIVNAMDGTGGLTQEPVPPGGSFDYRFTPPDSGLFWYHPQVLPFAREQQGRGLYGVMIVDEPEPPQVDRDMLVVLDDWKLDGKGQIAGFDTAPDAGRMGALVTVNARAVPVDQTLPPSSRLRLRILSAADARFMVIAFNGVTPLILAVDSQPCEAFEPAMRMLPCLATMSRTVFFFASRPREISAPPCRQSPRLRKIRFCRARSSCKPRVKSIF